MEYTEDREFVAELLRKTTRVQLGEAIFDNFHEVQLFKVAYDWNLNHLLTKKLSITIWSLENVMKALDY